MALSFGAHACDASLNLACEIFSDSIISYFLQSY